MTGVGGGFTGTGAMGPVEKPLFLPQPPKKRKDRKTAVREAAQRVVDRLLEADDPKQVFKKATAPLAPEEEERLEELENKDGKTTPQEDEELQRLLDRHYGRPTG